MYVPLKVLVVGAVLISLIAFGHLLIPVLLALLLLGLIRRAWFAARWRRDDDGEPYGQRFWHRDLSASPGSRRIPTIDGSPARYASAQPARYREIPSI